MRVKIIDKTNDNKDINIKLPMGIINTNLFWKFIIKHTDEKYKIKGIRKVSKELFKNIKKYIKHNGHFCFLEIESTEAIVKIIL